MNEIICGDCIEVMKTLPDNSVDSVVTDPPYNLTSTSRPRPDQNEDGSYGKQVPFSRQQSRGGFMGKEWDGTGIAFKKELWQEVLRVLKPGGHLLSFGGTRTYHRMACAIEDAGFEIRDMVEWIYGSGFPKSLNIGKAIDKLQGNERELIGTNRAGSKERNGYKGDMAIMPFETKTIDLTLTKGTSEWEGWGTALKPAHEPICLARKPLGEKSVAENVLKWGTGGMNIDKSRVGTEEISVHNAPKGTFAGGEAGRGSDTESYRNHQGRFPANLCHDNSEEVRECFPETKSGGGLTKRKNEDAMFDFGQGYEREEISDSGNASRFFKSIIYTAKASKSERDRGCEGMEEKKRFGGGIEGASIPLKGSPMPTARNNHPTVKPLDLMKYLIEMITPPKGIVLDPFAGSGSTLVAAKETGFNFIGIEKEEDYCRIAEARVAATPKPML